MSRWQLGATSLDLNPLSPWCGEPAFYELYAAGEAPLRLHPSRVVRFLGNPLPDPSLSGHPWSDSVLQALYDAVHAAALTTAGATSLMHEAKVDVVTVPNLSEHLSSAETTAQLSARFAYAAAMKSINNLLLLGDGESWARQRIDFGGLPEMVRTFLQMAAGAADIPVTRLLGQSPAGLSATGDSDTRNYYDMIAARQELDLRPQLERLDRLICRSEGIDEGALTFAFRPLWQLDGPAKAALALSKAQATQIYAGLGLWPAEVTAKLVEAQLVADGTYPNAAALFSDPAVADASNPLLDYAPSQPRAPDGRWTAMGGAFALPESGFETSTSLQQRNPTATGSMPTPVRIAATTRNLQHTCKKFRLDENDASDALRAAKNDCARTSSRDTSADSSFHRPPPRPPEKAPPMPYTVPSPADLAARFPAFAAVPPAALAGAIAEAQTRVDTSWLPGDYPIAVMLLAAHTLTLDGLGTGAEAAAAAAGTLGYASLRSGGLSLERARAPRGAAEPSILAETTYGRRFLALLKVNHPAVLVP